MGVKCPSVVPFKICKEPFEIAFFFALRFRTTFQYGSHDCSHFEVPFGGRFSLFRKWCKSVIHILKSEADTFDLPLVAGCSKGHKLAFAQVINSPINKCDERRTINVYIIKLFSIILGSYYHTDVYVVAA